MSTNNISKDNYFSSISLKIKDVLILNGCFVIFLIIYSIIYLLIRNVFESRISMEYKDVLFYIYFSIVIYHVYKHKLNNFNFLGINQPNVRRNLKFAAALILFIYFTKICVHLLSGQYLSINVKDTMFFISPSLWLFALHSIIAITIGPIIEEILFRGFFYPPLRGRFGIGKAIMISSLIFTLWHFGLNIKELIHVFLIGVLLAYIYEKTASLIPSIIAHSIINLNSTIVTSYSLLKEDKNISLEPVKFLVLLAVAYLALSLVLYVFYRRDKFTDSIES